MTPPVNEPAGSRRDALALWLRNLVPRSDRDWTDWQRHADDLVVWLNGTGVAFYAPDPTPTDGVLVPRQLLGALEDPDECWFDHHGGCQAHGYLSLEPGEVCPQAQVKALLAVTAPVPE